jgi:hypothetical protein
LCFWFGQITRTTPRRRMILHLSQIRLSDALTFMPDPSSQLLDDPPAGAIPRAQLQPHAIADQHADEIPSRPARHVRGHVTLPIDLHAVLRVRQRLPHDPFDGIRGLASW